MTFTNRWWGQALTSGRRADEAVVLKLLIIEIVCADCCARVDVDCCFGEDGHETEVDT
jgi:hypothetical protein